MRFRLLAVPLVLATLSACQSVETDAQLTSPASGAVQTAGPGDTVLSFRATRSLPNAFGKADLFGRKVDAGQTNVRYLGIRGGRAVFERNDVSVESNATTMNQTPLFVPQVSTTTLDGTVGTTPVSARATSAEYAIVGPRPTTSYAMAARPIELTLGRGESTVIQGRTLTVTRIGPGSIDYRTRERTSS